MMLLGAILVGVIVVFLYVTVLRIPGFSEFLLTESTVAFVDFPTKLHPAALQFFKKQTGINWEVSVASWAGDRSALALLKDDQNTDAFIPFVLVQVRSLNDAYQELKKYRNESGEIHEKRVGRITTYETNAINFTFLSDIVVVAPSEEALDYFLKQQSSLKEHLSNNSDFRNSRKKLPQNFFFYSIGEALKRLVTLTAATALPRLPIELTAVKRVSIGADYKDGQWRGASVTLLENNSQKETQQKPYRATLMSLIPDKLDTLIIANNAAQQLKKLDGAASKQLIDAYLPGFNIDEVFPLMGNETAIAVSGSSVLVITELSPEVAPGVLEKLHQALRQVGGKEHLYRQKVTLPDGTEAEEIIAETDATITEEVFEGTDVKLIGKPTLAYTMKDNKLFISSSVEMLKKSMLLMQSNGQSFRDSVAYRTYLQPILKNPELTGISRWGPITFAFSKRTIQNMLETNFILAVEGQ